MRETKKQERALANIAALMAKHGMSIGDAKVEDFTSHDDNVQATEGVLLSLEKPGRFTLKMCKRCDMEFGTDYKYVAYCSDNCRAKALLANGFTNVNYYGKTQQERWGGEPPTIIPPAAVEKMRQVHTALEHLLYRKDHTLEEQGPPVPVHLDPDPQTSLVS